MTFRVFSEARDIGIRRPISHVALIFFGLVEWAQKFQSGFPLQTLVLPVESLPAKLVELDLPGEVPPDGLEDVVGHGELEGVPVPLLPDLRVAVVELERT